MTQDAPNPAAPPPAPRSAAPWARNARRWFWPAGLSARLLVLTALFVMAGETLILAPSLAGFVQSRLEERVRAAELASLAVEAAPDQIVTDTLASQLLAGAGVVSVAVQSDGIRRLLLQGPPMRRAPELVDLRRSDLANWLTEPFAIAFGPKDQMVRVVAKPRFRDGDFVEIITPRAPLRRELGSYLLGLLGVTAFVAVVAGLLIYLSLDALLVKPMRRITLGMERFRADPDDPRAKIAASSRRDEIGRAEAELNRMQADLRAALASRARLAALGEAVAKINHDLRNMLTSAQIASERLAMSGDPSVAKVLPRLERALDRAVALASDVLDYGKSEERAPVQTPTALLAAAEAAAEDAGLRGLDHEGGPAGVLVRLSIDPALEVMADPEQLHRILVNLLRNARQAIESAPEPHPSGLIQLAAERRDGAVTLRVADNGPGLPAKAVDALFQPFAGSTRPGGTGLGLAISRELAKANGGELNLASTSSEGAVFELGLPAV
ncbi:MAG TPA: HAMP domain-containing sensor histidine kinase [Caulobacteraceae bacterium]|nr:HAMP domain-containing sensor histidine kinase [Caulobacteraceae bacterium]